jgi:two-component system CheB/CheR fusion protein
MLEADAARIEQVVWNLLGHALKATPRGGRIEVALRLLDDRAELHVCDGGPTPEPEALAQAFDLLRTPESGASRRQGDLGVGLALVRVLVQAHGGLVDAKAAEAGRGTCYTIALPLAGRSLAPVGGSAEPALRLQGRRALLLDEDAASQQTLRELLTLEGATVHTAGTAEEALAIAGREALDFALVDVPLREMDGAHFLGQLRGRPGLQAMPVIALTALGRAVDAKRAIAAGFTAHVKKPITLEQLLQVLGEALA